jgi:hypothetical protein
MTHDPRPQRLARDSGSVAQAGRHEHHTGPAQADATADAIALIEDLVAEVCAFIVAHGATIESPESTVKKVQPRS